MHRTTGRAGPLSSSCVSRMKPTTAGLPRADPMAGPADRVGLLAPQHGGQLEELARAELCERAYPRRLRRRDHTRHREIVSLVSSGCGTTLRRYSGASKSCRLRTRPVSHSIYICTRNALFGTEGPAEQRSCLHLSPLKGGRLADPRMPKHPRRDRASGRFDEWCCTDQQPPDQEA